MKEKISDWLNRFLVFDVFIVFFGFIWFIVAVVGLYLGFPQIFDIWYKLWIPIFNPAIGIIFLGVFVNWVISKFSNKKTS